jgi:predicted Zn-dependent protease
MGYLLIRIFQFLLVVFILIVVAGCAPRALVVKMTDDTPLTPQQETRLGEILSGTLIQYLGGDCPDSGLENHVNQVAGRLMTDNRSQRIQVRVADHSDPHSLALPGSVVVVTRGLLQELETEAQLAALLAREIGYFQSGLVTETMRSMVRGRAVFLQDVQPGDANYSQRLLLVRELTDVALHRSYGNEKDNSPDIAAIDVLVRSGYSLNGFFELDEMWRRLNRKAIDSGRSVSPDQLTSLRLQAARDYIAATYPDYRGAESFDSNTNIRRLANHGQPTIAYQLYDQARSAEAAGEQTRALQLYHQAIQQQQRSLLLTALGMAYLRGEDLIPARRYLRQAVHADADFYQSHLGLGYIHLRRSEWSDAVAELEASLALFPTLQGTFLLAETEEGRGNVARARALYHHLLEVDGQSTLGRAAAERLRRLPR